MLSETVSTVAKKIKDIIEPAEVLRAHLCCKKQCEQKEKVKTSLVPLNTNGYMSV
jgi:hypothetical protein